MQTAPEVLTKAIEVIEKKGWTKGTYQSKDGKVCAAAAVNLVLTNGESVSSTMGFINRELQCEVVECLNNSLPKGKLKDFIVYNDLKTTRKRDIIRLFKRAAKNCARS